MRIESSQDKNNKFLEKPLTDPRRKDGQGFDFWADALRKQNLISEQEYKDFISQNNSKEEAMERRGVPQLRHYGLFNSVDDIREKLAPHEKERFIIRCTSRENRSIKRLIDASLDEACDFAENLPGGFEKWDVEMKEFVNTKASGTIIVEPSGKTTIETWEGPHYLNTENIPKYHAQLDPDQFHLSFQWSSTEGANNLPEHQEYAMKALRYIFPHLRPKPNDPIYIEYAVKPDGEVYFIETNDSPLVTGRQRK